MKDFNFETDNATGRNHEGNKANAPLKVLTASSIIGDSVENPEGQNLGTIRDIMINLQESRIEYIVLQYGGFLGIGDKLFAIPFNSLRVDEEKEVFILDRSKEYLEKAPGFDQDHWPETNGHHFNEVNGYWGNFMGPNTGSEF